MIMMVGIMAMAMAKGLGGFCKTFATDRVNNAHNVCHSTTPTHYYGLLSECEICRSRMRVYEEIRVSIARKKKTLNYLIKVQLFNLPTPSRPSAPCFT